jgi:cell division septal protein FtsQ
MMIFRKIFSHFILIFPAAAMAQQIPAGIQPSSAAKLHVKSITVKGNKKTRDYVVLREIQFNAGDSIVTASLTAALERARYTTPHFLPM